MLTDLLKNRLQSVLRFSNPSQPSALTQPARMPAVLQPGMEKSLSLDYRLNVAEMIAERTLRLLKHHLHAINDVSGSRQVIFVVVPLPDRTLLIFNAGVIGPSLPVEFVEHLRETLQGRLVVFSRLRPLYLQISYWPMAETKRPGNLQSLPLDLAQQPTPLHVPLGMSRQGPEWRDLTALDAAVIAGPRGKGKTRLMHAWIQALVHGGQAKLLLWDRKSGNEFGRYRSLPHVTVVESGDALEDDKTLLQALERLQQEIAQRAKLYAAAGATNLAEYNARSEAKLLPLVLFIDEAADLSGETADLLVRLVRLARSYGVHPVVGIQRPDAEVMKGQLRANLPTRICFSVVSHTDSKIALGYTGAERLPKLPGRFLINEGAELLEVQAFTVTLPNPGQHGDTPRLRLLSSEETRMVQTAVELNGWFNIQEIAGHLGIDAERVVEKAKGWAERGLLTTIQYDTTQRPPRRLGRRITPALVEMAGLPEVPNLAHSGEVSRTSPNLDQPNQN